MKLQTKIDDLKKHITASTAEQLASRHRQALDQSITCDTRDSIITALDQCLISRAAATAARVAVDNIPAPRRTAAGRTAEQAILLGRQAARMGDPYSGQTGYAAHWTDAACPSADTTTGRGGRYSRSSKFSKTDAEHVVRLSPEWTPLLVESGDICALSAADGLPLIGIAADGRCCWVKKKGKAITEEIGWIANFGSTIYHSTHSQADADRMLPRKLAAVRQEWTQQQERAKDYAKARKEDRRARLIARLCIGAVATLADARALGYCLPGIEQFQAQHHIGDSAPLPELVRTGNPSAVRLALEVARRYSHQTVA